MELLQLRYFRTVAKMGSITRAADYYSIPQSSMSQTISRLENELGAKLFDRRNNRIYLNDKGRIFLDSVTISLMELENGIQKVSSFKNEVSGSVNILAAENRRFVLNCVEVFGEKYPNVNFSISHDYYGDYENYDLIITSTLPHNCQTLDYKPCIKESILINVHESHPLAERKKVKLSELKDERFISMTSRSILYAITYDSCRLNGFEPNVPFICDDPYFVRKFVSQKMGVALVPEISWEGRFRENTRLVQIQPPITTTSYVVWDNRKFLSSAVTLFRDFLIEEAHKLESNLL